MPGIEPPLSLYVHLPWCVRKCPYCDFNSHAAGRVIPADRYVDALLRDLGNEAERAADRSIISVFLGGGTPSLFSPRHIGTLLAAIDARCRLAAGAEITMEANPGTIEHGDPAGYRRAGVNRLSIGAQSFEPRALAVLGRIHAVADIERSVHEAREAGFANINLDLMYGLPGQDAAAAIADIDRAADLEPAHLSWYQLTLEPNTVFHARPPAGLPDEDACFEIQQCGQARLASRGFEQYEVSAWARGGARSVHNLNYWTFGDYLAIGAGAHGKLSDAGGIWRYAKPAHPLGYMEAMERGDFSAGMRPVPVPELVFEFMLNALRLTGGFSEATFCANTGLSVADLHRRLAPSVGKGLLDPPRAGYWRASALGQRFLNDLQAAFLP
jgi:putative oxygen-independent coproporphyrinogen III oxidase